MTRSSKLGQRVYCDR